MEGLRVKGYKAIERYLADLDDSLRVSLRRRQRILREARLHLDEWAEAYQRQGASREEAERLATAAFGPPEEVAASHGRDGSTRIGRGAVGLADCWYRVGEYLKEPQNREALRSDIALIAAVPFALAVIKNLLDGSPLYRLMAMAVVCSVSCAAIKTWTGLRSLPRPGYGRRWLKLDPVARRRIMRALREGSTLTDPREAEFVAELRGRARGLGLTMRWFFGPFAVLFTVLPAVALLATGEVHASDAAIGFFALLFWWLLVTDSRRARDQAKEELLALDILHHVAGEAVHEGRARLEESTSHSPGDPFHPGHLQFRLVPVGAAASPVSLEAKKGMIQLWQESDDHPQEFEADDPEQLRKLRKQLAATWPDAVRTREGHDLQ